MVATKQKTPQKNTAKKSRHSERSEESPHFAFAVVFAFDVAVVIILLSLLSQLSFSCHPSPKAEDPAVVLAVAVVVTPTNCCHFDRSAAEWRNPLLYHGDHHNRIKIPQTRV
ncbi:MAG: hypothetical protein WDN23_15515 [Edaphobacter sp.]